MDWYYILLIAVAVTVLFVIVSAFMTAAIIYKIIFGSRQDKNPMFRYFTAEDFGLTKEKFPVQYGRAELNSNLYFAQPVESCEKVVVFVHGFGAGSASYTTEIAHFARAGYAVVATDAYGCNGSAGNNIKGFYAGTQAVIATFEAVKADARLNGKKTVLVGHSWGAYSVLTASERVQADGVVALSSFDKPAQSICDNLIKMRALRFYAKMLCVDFWLIKLFKFGVRGNRSAVKAVEKSGVPALLIHGEKDGVVPLKHSAAKMAQGGNIQKLILKDKRHNPYNTVAAEQKLSELGGADRGGDAADGNNFFRNFDWSAATEEDAEVMGKIDEFIASV